MNTLGGNGWTKCRWTKDTSRLIEESERICSAVFSLSDDVKESCSSPETNYLSGWRRPNARYRPTEVWHVTPADPPSTWPVFMTAERHTLLELLRRVVEAVTPIIFETAGGSIRAEDIARGVSTLRLLFYRGSAASWRFGPHTDLGLATVFLSESQRALQIREPRGDWHTVQPQPHQGIIAAGEMLAFIAGSHACEHRILRCAQDRYAMALFVHPDPATELKAHHEEVRMTAEVFFARELARRARHLRRY